MGLVLVTIGVYQIKNGVNGKIYVGSSIDIEHRWYRHRLLLNKNEHYNNHFQNAWNKYGRDNFEFSILEIVKSEEEILIKEQYWIDKFECYNNTKGYNVCRNAGNTLGVYHSENTKKLIGQRSKERNAVKHIYGHSMKGEEHPHAKLTDKDILAIKYILKNTDLTCESIGNYYGVTKSVIGNISKNRIWKHLHIPQDYMLPNEIHDFIKSTSRIHRKQLSDEEAKCIKMFIEYTNLKVIEIAKIFEIKRYSVSDIKGEKSFKHITLNDGDSFEDCCRFLFNNNKEDE